MILIMPVSVTLCFVVSCRRPISSYIITFFAVCCRCISNRTPSRGNTVLSSCLLSSRQTLTWCIRRRHHHSAVTENLMSWYRWWWLNVHNYRDDLVSITTWRLPRTH